MKKEIKYISDCGRFSIENGKICVERAGPIDNIEGLCKFLDEYRNEVHPPKDEISEAEKKFLEIIEGGKWEGEYYLKKYGQKIIYNPKSEYIWLDYGLFWKKINPHFNNEYNQVQLFMRNMLLKHLKIEGKTPLNNDIAASGGLFI